MGADGRGRWQAPDLCRDLTQTDGTHDEGGGALITSYGGFPLENTGCLSVFHVDRSSDGGTVARRSQAFPRRAPDDHDHRCGLIESWGPLLSTHAGKPVAAMFL